MGLMSAAGGLLASKLAKATAAVGDVVQGKTFYAGDKTLKTGTLALSGSAGTGDVRKGKTFYSTNPKSRQTGTLEDRGAWGTTIDPGGSVTVPAGIHNGGGKVTARNATTNFTAVNIAPNWGEGQIYEGLDTNAGSTNNVRIAIGYWSESEYNVTMTLSILRNGSVIDSVELKKDGGLSNRPNGFIEKSYSGAGTYKIRVNVSYHAGNGTIHFGGAIVGY